MNHKKLRRLWREEGLRRPPQHKAKKRRPDSSDGTLLRAEYPNHVWALDFQFDETCDLRRIKLLNIVAGLVQAVEGVPVGVLFNDHYIY